MLALKILAFIFLVIPASVVVAGLAFCVIGVTFAIAALMLGEHKWVFAAISSIGCLLVIGVLAVLGWLMFTHYWFGAAVLVGAAVVIILLLDHMAESFIQTGTRLRHF